MLRLEDWRRRSAARQGTSPTETPSYHDALRQRRNLTSPSRGRERPLDRFAAHAAPSSQRRRSRNRSGVLGEENPREESPRRSTSARRTNHSSSQSSSNPRARGARKPSFSRRACPRSTLPAFFFLGAASFFRLLGSRRSSHVCRSTGGAPPPSLGNERIGAPPDIPPSPWRGGGGRLRQAPPAGGGPALPPGPAGRSPRGRATSTVSGRPRSDRSRNLGTASRAAAPSRSDTKPKPRRRPSGSTGRCSFRIGPTPASRNISVNSSSRQSLGRFARNRVFSRSSAPALPPPPPEGAGSEGPRYGGGRDGMADGVLRLPRKGRTEIGRPSCREPSNASRTISAWSSDASVMKPKPRALPVWRSRGTATSSTLAPAASNILRSSISLTPSDRPATKSLRVSGSVMSLGVGGLKGTRILLMRQRLARVRRNDSHRADAVKLHF